MQAKINLYDFQESTVRKTAKALTKSDKVLVVLPTGAGKSIVIAYIANNIKGRTLVLTHRAEILKQNSEWLNNLGVLTRDENSVSLSNTVVIAMVQTLDARIKKYGINYIGQFNSIIIDEAHIDIFQKVYKLYNTKYLIGFTATPTMTKKELITKDGIEWWKKITLKKQYDDLVVGTTVKELIEKGFLVEDKNYTLKLPNMNQLVSSSGSPDGYTSDSLTKVYSNKASLKILHEVYMKYCVGKKVLLFNATTKVNLPVTELFRKMNVPAMNFDSVNSKPKDRQKVLDWYNKTRSGVLIGTNVFTTGFNVRDIEVVIVNRATTSLSLWLQMVGRGSRTTDIIDKKQFIVIDLGQNIEEHGLWSDVRDWHEHFDDSKLKPKKKMDIELVWECSKCGALNSIAEQECESCGADKGKAATVKRPDKTGKIIEVEKTETPKAKYILSYAYTHDLTRYETFKVLDNQILTMFKKKKVSKEEYIDKKDLFAKRIRELYKPPYQHINRSKKLTGPRRKLDTQLLRVTKKIDDYYGI